MALTINSNYAANVAHRHLSASDSDATRSLAKLSAGNKVDPTQLAEDISLALITTALGLTIAIPLIVCTNSINVRIRKLEDLVGYGLTRFLEIFKAAMTMTLVEEKKESQLVEQQEG